LGSIWTTLTLSSKTTDAAMGTPEAPADAPRPEMGTPPEAPMPEMATPPEAPAETPKPEMKKVRRAARKVGPKNDYPISWAGLLIRDQ
jgi:hypothetical protein